MSKYLTYKKDSNLENAHRFKKLMDIVQGILSTKNPKQITILDIGSGDGQFMKFIKKESSEKLILDLSALINMSQINLLILS